MGWWAPCSESRSSSEVDGSPVGGDGRVSSAGLLILEMVQDPPDEPALGDKGDEAQGCAAVLANRRAGKTQISANGGDEPVWARDGREFHREGESKLMAVKITTRPAFAATRAQVVFEDKEGRYLKNGFDVGPDGRFVMVDAKENRPASSTWSRTGSRT